MEQFRVLQRLGKGAQGAVYLAENRIDGKKYVLKKVECKDEGEANQAYREAAVLRDVQHPYICGYKEFFVTWDKEDCAIYLCIVIEHYDHGDLSSVLSMKRDKEEAVDETLVKKWLGQMAEALLFVHKKGIIHRDLKPSNLFLQDGMDLRLGDFGVATVMGDARSNPRAAVGTMNYVAPEVLTGHYDERCDIWSLGCILLELLTCHLLASLEMVETLTELKVEDSSVLEDTLEKITEQYSAPLVTVVRSMLKKNPDQRPSVVKLLTVPYVKECVDMVNTDLIEKKKKQVSAGLNRKPVPREKGSAAVLEHLRTVINNEDKVRDTLTYLLELSRQDEAGKMDALGKLLLVEAMTNHLSDKDIQLTGLNILQNLIVYAEPGDIIYSEDIVSVVPRLLKLHKDSADLQQAGANILMAMSADVKAAVLIGSQGGVADLLDAIGSFGDNVELCAACCNALWSLAVSEKNAMLLSECGGMTIVCKSLRSHMNSSDVAETAAATLLSLSMEENTIQYIGDLETIGLLVRAVDIHADNAKVIKNSCLALASFVELDEESAFKVLACQQTGGEPVAGLPIIVAAYNVHKDNADVVEAVCTLFMELAQYDEIRAEMHYLKLGQTMLAEVQKRFKENRDIMVPCEAAMVKLGPAKTSAHKTKAA